jgi:uncharacterized phiE125 gp8 family phage protein
MLTQIATDPDNTVEPVTVSELAWNLRLTADPEQEYTGVDAVFLAGLISAAREEAENFTDRHFVEKTYQKTFRCFYRVMPLTANVTSVTSVSYLDGDSVLQTVSEDDFIPYLTSSRCSVEFLEDFSVPVTARRNDAITVGFTVGPSVLSKTVKQAIIMLASHWYENREAASVAGTMEVKEVPLSFGWLLLSHRVPAI